LSGNMLDPMRRFGTDSDFLGCLLRGGSAVTEGLVAVCPPLLVAALGDEVPDAGAHAGAPRSRRATVASEGSASASPCGVLQQQSRAHRGRQQRGPRHRAVRFRSVRALLMCGSTSREGGREVL